MFYIKRTIITIIGGLFLLTIGCFPVEEEVITDIKLDFKDPVYQKIYNFQDQLLTDSLLPYLLHKDPSYRYAAAVSFASIKDKSVVNALVGLLSDPVDEVKTAAAYALGQIGSEASEGQLVRAFMNDTLATTQSFKKTVLEAVGKSASEKYLLPISTVKSYLRTDTLALEGQAYAIYRYALRGKTIPEGTNRMLTILTKKGYPESVRLIAANYLQRAKNITLDSVAGDLYRVVQNENNPLVLAPLAIALGKTKNPVGLEALKYLYGKTGDTRVRVNVVRALGNFEYEPNKELVLAAIKDDDLHLAIAASRFLIQHGTPRDAAGYFAIAKNTPDLPWQVRANLLEAANTFTPRFYTNTLNNINAYTKSLLDNPNTGVYEKAALMRVLGAYSWNYKYIHDKGYQSEQPMVRGASVEALAGIARSEDFNTFFAGSAKRVQAELAEYFKEAIEKSDIGMMYNAAHGLMAPKLDFSTDLDTLGFMETALRNLDRPKEIEIYYELQKALAHLKGTPAPTPQPPAFNHPIDWNLIGSINPAAKAEIFTSKGTITMELMLRHAPGTVANFVQLARNNFYDGKLFHRVIPNFVVQGGCPRGDGWGALDYSIRSELGPVYYDDEGYVGMASAGNHTECTQWFITHSPTPHLDGNYTIFGKIVDGMDVVDELQIGDRITDVKVLN